MTTIIKSIGALLISAALLLAGGGLLATLVAVSADQQGFSVIAIGIIASFYFAGFMAGCLVTPVLVARVGHVRVFAALSSLVAVCTLSHMLLINVPSWAILRALTGFCFAGLYMLIESWINEQTPNAQRGQVLSIYRMVDLGALTVGQFLLTLADPKDFTLFSVVAILICLAIFPISVSASKAPADVTQSKLDLRKLYRVSPLAVVGAFGVGLVSGAFWGVAPVFIRLLGHPVMMVSTFMITVIATGAVMQWPMGRLSDKIGRRQMIIFTALGGMISGIFLWQMAPISVAFLLIGGGLYGVFAMQVYGMVAAHANDHAEPGEFVAVSGGLLLVYGIGSVVGPSAAPLVMSVFEPSAMFAYTACVHGLVAIYGLYRLTRRAAPKQTTDYVPNPRPRAAMLILRSDPRNILKRKKPAKKKKDVGDLKG